MLKILDLDDSSTYTKEYEQILYAEDVWPILEDDFKGTGEILQEFINYPTEIKNHFAKDLWRKCEKVFRENYAYVIAYHACRTTDPSEYHRLGLLTSSRNRLEVKAREIFAGIKNLDKAIAESAVYFSLYDGSISMYISAKFASTEYLNEGSHYFRKVAAKLGREGEQRLSIENRKSKPVFVKCKIPVSWFEDAAIVNQRFKLYLYNASLIRRLIWARADNGEPYKEHPESLVIFKAIPPENILSILDADICSHWKG